MSRYEVTEEDGLTGAPQAGLRRDSDADGIYIPKARNRGDTSIKQEARISGDTQIFLEHAIE